MKNIYFVLILAVNFSFAQDIRLFENYWYLRKVTIDAVEHLPPTTMGLEFQDGSMIITGCLPMSALPTFENNTTNFSASNFVNCLCWCTDPVAQSYENLYFSVFTDQVDSSATAYFTYSISEVGAERTLIINGPDNRQATYSNIMLSARDFDQANYSVFPNPSADYIVFKSVRQITGCTTVDFYNELGKNCKSVEFSAVEATIDIGDLPAGIYFLTIKSDAGTAIKKLVKI